MPKKKKSDNWQPDYPEKEKKSKKRGNVTGNVVAQKKKGWGATLLPREKRRKKKCNLN